ncbi:hypothetical protein BDB00DRAFT_341371 [Zychaea mexicana]|uniref:uncharacterized protein n=1 Tax=Zychaea mexicana TaxID=64656 RepID=UPI0022FE67B1|nr:uncharacterized protein BDB00DRAFT_341371 [Zychaea mexicana]KAI9494014.1 hypothetical protein BDB00DRAFT_341371 [Zychaea mexicana]
MASSVQLTKFGNQVAGHDKLLQFSTNDLMVIKPSTQTELQFYEDSQNDLEFRCWIPKCYGSLHAATESELQMLEQQQGNGQLEQEGAAQVPLLPQQQQQQRLQDSEGRPLDEHLCLENLLHGFTRPCIMDLKIGSRLYDNDADEAKITKMKENAKGTTIESLAARIAGMKVYDTTRGEWALYDKNYGKSRTKDDIADAILAYFFPTSSYAHISEEANRKTLKDEKAAITSKRISSNKMEWLLECFIEEVSGIREYLEEHPSIQLIGSSLLFIYEGDKNAADAVWKKMLEEDRKEKQQQKENEDKEGDEDEEEEEEEERPPMYDLRLIDFAHSSWSSKQEEQDPGILKGLDSVLKLLEQCLERQQQEKL